MSPRRWDQLEAKMKAEKENGVPAKSAAPKAEPNEPEGKTLEQVMEESVGPEVLDVKCFGPLRHGNPIETGLIVWLTGSHIYFCT